MANYRGDVHTDALSAQSAAYQNAYHPMQSGMGMEGVMEHDFLAPPGYYAPPLAPRLTAAAARASSMAAMYYSQMNPSMPPFGGQPGSMDPWVAPPYPSQDMGRGSKMPIAYQHQQVEHHLMAQRGHAASSAYSVATAAYGYERQQPGHYQPRHSYPDGRADHYSQSTWINSIPPSASSAWAWHGGAGYTAPTTSHRQQQRRITDATPTVYDNRQSSSYFDNAADCQQQQHQHHNDVYSASMNVDLNAWDHNAVPYNDGVWHGRGMELRKPIRSMNGYSDAWPQGHSDWVERGQGAARGIAKPPAMHDPWQNRMATGNDANTAMPDSYQRIPATQARVQENVDPLAIGPDCVTYGTNGQPPVDAPTEQSKSAPAPPSPGTLDKSSVPISSVGAEIIWSVCAAFMEPELVAMSTRRQRRAEVRNRRSPPSSSASTPTPYTLTPLTAGSGSSSPQQRISRSISRPQALHRLIVNANSGDGAAVSSEESSASSSEPGTPPSSSAFSAYLHDEANVKHNKLQDAMENVQELRGLGLSATDISFEKRPKHKDAHSETEVSVSQLRREGAKESGEGPCLASALDLVSPTWPWSLHDDKFASLSCSLREGASQMDAEDNTRAPRFLPSSLRSQSSASDMRRSMSHRREEMQALFGSEPSPAFRQFAHQVLAQTLVSPTAFILALMYALRVPYLAVQIDGEGMAGLDIEAREIFAQPLSAAPFKLFTLGLMIANKHLDDNTFLNKTWNEVTGISLTEINRMERWYLERCSYEIAVPEEPWVTFLERLACRTENRIARMVDAKRGRTSSKDRCTISPIASGDTRTVGGLTQEDALKRMMLSIEEALVLLGRIAPFELCGSRANVDSPAADVPSRGHDRLHSQSCEKTEHFAPRPGSSLHHLHQHCRSAPSVSFDHGVLQDMHLDVFDDEEGPYRPQGSDLRRNDRRSKEPALNRSMSQETGASLAWQQQRSSASSNWHTSMANRAAPLAPSILLDLLNRGQQLAHNAH